MKLNLYLNREQMPAKVAPGDTLTVQITPFGDWPHGDAVQHVSREACERMVNAWTRGGSKEILVDFDHDAEEGKSTVAAAWLKNVRVDDARGLVGDFTFTDKGAEAVSSRQFRFLSPCWEVEVNRWTKGGTRSVASDDTPAEVTPTRLVSVALTNKPNIPVAPLLNREPTPGVKSVQQKEGNEMDPQKIKEALGLAPEATEEDILAALGKLKAENEEAAREREEAQKAAAEKEADEFAEANAKKCNKEVVKAQYLANKEATIALVNAIPEPKAVDKPVCNREAAKTPTFENADTDEKVLATYENMAPGKAKDDFLMANAVVINRARNARAAAK